MQLVYLLMKFSFERIFAMNTEFELVRLLVITNYCMLLTSVMNLVVEAIKPQHFRHTYFLIKLINILQTTQSACICVAPAHAR